MDILLTDGEIKQLTKADGYLAVGCEGREGARVVAKAQLRKVEPLLRWAYKEGYEDSARKCEADDTMFAKKIGEALS